MRRRSTSRLSRSTTGVGVRSRQHVVSPIRVTDKLHGRVQVSEMTRKGSPAYGELVFLFRSTSFTRSTMLLPQKGHRCKRTPRVRSTGSSGPPSVFPTAVELFFFIVLGALSTISLSSRLDTAGDGSTVVGGSTVGASPGGLTIDTRTGCCLRCSSMVLYRSNS